MLAALAAKPHRLAEVPQRGAIADASVAIGTPALRSAVTDLLGRASASAHADVFRVSDPQMVDAMVSLPGRGLAVSTLADTDASVGPQADRLRAMSDWHGYGAPPSKQHGKTLSRDAGAEALVGTDVSDAAASNRIELGVTFGGAPARALGLVHAGSKAAGPEMLHAALTAAADLGVVVNDPRVGARHATEALIALLQATPAKQPIRIVTKEIDSQGFTELVARLAPGRDVDLLTHAIPKSQRATLEDAGVDVSVVGERRALQAARALHGTVITAGDRAYVGSLYAVDRVLDGSTGRRSREAGVVLEGAAAAQARDAVAAIHAAQG